MLHTGYAFVTDGKKNFLFCFVEHVILDTDKKVSSVTFPTMNSCFEARLSASGPHLRTTTWSRLMRANALLVEMRMQFMINEGHLAAMMDAQLMNKNVPMIASRSLSESLNIGDSRISALGKIGYSKRQSKSKVLRIVGWSRYSHVHRDIYKKPPFTSTQQRFRPTYTGRYHPPYL